MDLLYLKLQHSARADLLRGCNSIKPLQQQQEQEEICFEELRAKLYQYRFDYSKLNIDQQYITTGSPTSAVTATSKPRMVKRASKPSILVCRANKKNILLTNKSKERKSLGRHPTIAKHTLGSTALQHPHRKSMGITDSRHKRLTAAFQKINKLDTFEKHSSNGMTLKNAMLMVEEKEEEEKEGQDGTLLSTQPEKVKELGSYQVSHRQQAKESEAQVVSDVQRPSTSFKLINDELIGRKGQRQDIQKPFSEHPLDLDGKKSVRRETPTMVPLPHSPQFVRERMERYNLYRHKAFHDYRDENNKSLTTDRLKQWFPPPSTSAGMKALSSSTLAQHQHLRLIDLGERQFHVIRKIGEGGMANVYLVQNTKDLTIHSLKIQQPPHAWEFYIVYQLYHRKKHRERIQANKSRGSGSSTHSATTGAYDGGGAHSRLNLLLINEFFYYKNASFLLMEYIPYGTLLDALNLYRPSQIFMPEPIVLLFMSQLLSQLVHLHQLHIVHNDLKLDNVLLLSTYKNRHDKNRGNKQTRLPTLYLIDYGQSIDVLALLNKSQMMTNSGHKHNLLVKANWPPTCPKADFPYLNEGYYPFHADYWQLAAMAHWLLFGSPMRTYKKKTDCSLNAFVLYQSIKRYWHKHLWARFFHLLLNPSMAETQDASTVLLQQLADEFWTAGKDVDLSLISAFNDLLLYRQR
ncbi:kinase-like domain-containing protein [Mycotypha africana]|uniref:kinase-like domain-containing protein n=1 Tax=Mycotypha africana TaxID=64632 RepID=UPI002301DBA9|nr:kinase-like domain-containing protein [Mycotypha africana]KAI8968225.1 kinase-like domain-containing protein [Mycotypha africana]